MRFKFIQANFVLAGLIVAVGPIGAQSPDPKIADPTYGRHVVPLLARLGCNSGSCHGAVQGQNGFRLSLFGVDPSQDREHLVRDAAGRRLDLNNPANSLFLLKAVGRIPHEGGVRVRPQSWEHDLLLKWVTNGVPTGDLAKSRGTAILMVTHDPRILDIADRIVAMEDGRIVEPLADGAAPH